MNNKHEQPSYKCRVRKSTSFTCSDVQRTVISMRAIVMWLRCCCLSSSRPIRAFHFNKSGRLHVLDSGHTHTQTWIHRKWNLFSCLLCAAMFVCQHYRIHINLQPKFVAENIPFAVKMKTRFFVIVSSLAYRMRERAKSRKEYNVVIHSWVWTRAHVNDRSINEILFLNFDSIFLQIREGAMGACVCLLFSFN